LICHGLCRSLNQSENRGKYGNQQPQRLSIEQLLDRIVDAESNEVVKAYEKRIGQLQLDKHVMKEKIAKCGRP